MHLKKNMRKFSYCHQQSGEGVGGVLEVDILTESKEEKEDGEGAWFG